MDRRIIWLAVLACGASLTACANLNSIARSTALPSPETTQGKAVHLDAQQRVVLINGLGAICSEPSPDALAAFAASLGLGASVPGAGAGSLAGGQQSSAASIGLRTQSITLMRDALFRMCEAYANGAVGPAQIATLLGRSQDLTAVILAVEQLTGAVAANQVALTGTTSASASASLLSNQKLLDSAREDETRKEAEFEEAKADLASAEKKRDEEQRKEAAAKAEHERVTADGSGTTATEKADARTAWEQRRRDHQAAQREVDAARSMVETRKLLLEEARRNREIIESAKDAALTSASAGTTSSGQFSSPLGLKELDKEATEAIAASVESMVRAVLRKGYTEESCMAMLTYIPRDYDKWPTDQKGNLKSVQELCKDIILRSLSERIETASYGVDQSSERIDAWLKQDEANRAKLAAWLDAKKVGFSPTLLRLGAGNDGLRKLAIIELGIP